MLSKVLPQPEGEIQTPTWRTNGSGRAAAAARPRVAAAPAADHAAAGNKELEAQVQQQLQIAYESGVREGETAARQKLEGEVQRAVEQLAVAASELAASRVEAIRQAEAGIVQLSLEIARRILHREVSIDPAALGALVRAALEKLASQQVCRVRVHPDQEQIVRATLAELGRSADIEVVAEAGQARGAVFETGSGFLDASVETQLREIERGLADRLPERA